MSIACGCATLPASGARPYEDMYTQFGLEESRPEDFASVSVKQSESRSDLHEQFDTVPVKLFQGLS